MSIGHEYVDIFLFTDFYGDTLELSQERNRNEFHVKTDSRGNSVQMNRDQMIALRDAIDHALLETNLPAAEYLGDGVIMEPLESRDTYLF